MKKLKVIIPMLSFLMIMASCEQESDPVPAQTSITDAQAKANNGRPKTMIWSDGLLFESVVTPAVFDGDHGNYDKLFAAGEGKSFQDGIGLISESKPGDQDYNGGRWHAYVLKQGVKTDYSNACSVEDLDLNDFEPTDNYFECPLLPRSN